MVVWSGDGGVLYTHENVAQGLAAPPRIDAPLHSGIFTAACSVTATALATTMEAACIGRMAKMRDVKRNVVAGVSPSSTGPPQRYDMSDEGDARRGARGTSVDQPSDYSSLLLDCKHETHVATIDTLAWLRVVMLRQ
jgi:hypothetical protein